MDPYRFVSLPGLPNLNGICTDPTSCVVFVNPTVIVAPPYSSDLYLVAGGLPGVWVLLSSGPVGGWGAVAGIDINPNPEVFETPSGTAPLPTWTYRPFAGGPPRVGNVFTLPLSSGASTNLAAAFVDFARVPGLVLPFNLTVFLDPVSAIGLPLALGENPAFALPIPPVPTLAGTQLFAQAATVSATNALAVSDLLQIHDPMTSPTTGSDLAALFAAAQHGDRGALPALLAAHANALLGFVRLHASARLRLVESCSDLAQSTCREALQDLDRFEFQHPAAFRAWLFGDDGAAAASPACTAQKRDPARAVSLSAAEELALLQTYAGVVSPSRHAAAREELRRFEAAFDQLPEDYRQVISLARIAQLPHEQIAETMQRSPQAVRNLLSRALARLAELMVSCAP